MFIANQKLLEAFYFVSIKTMKTKIAGSACLKNMDLDDVAAP